MSGKSTTAYDDQFAPDPNLIDSDGPRFKVGDFVRLSSSCEIYPGLETGTLGVVMYIYSSEAVLDYDTERAYAVHFPEYIANASICIAGQNLELT